jgi:hypothetical protein
VDDGVAAVGVLSSYQGCMYTCVGGRIGLAHLAARLGLEKITVK